MLKYICFVLFKTILTIPIVIAAINGFINDINPNLITGWFISIPISIFLLYDFIRSILIPWWKDDSTNFPVYWEGGGLE